MAERIVSLPSGACFTASDNENLLTAAQRAHWLVRYGCRNGNCEACAATLLTGSVSQAGVLIEASSSINADINRAQQTILLCLCRAESDLQIALPGNPRHGSKEQARRYYARCNSCTEVKSINIETNSPIARCWQIHITLPAGRLAPMYPGQYVLLEYNDKRLRAEIDTTAKGRELYLHSASALELTAGSYVVVHCPLGYCYAPSLQSAVLILHDAQQAQQAALLKAVLSKAHILKLDQLDLAPTMVFDTILICTQNQALAELTYQQLLTMRITFREFRSDFAIWYRWRVMRQDDNGNAFAITEGLSESAARNEASLYEQRGHKQLYWAEPMAF